MTKQPLFIALASPKGGVGKSTLTMLVASYLHYRKGYNVGVVDCDAPQHSVEELRELEVQRVTDDAYFNRLAFLQYEQSGKRAYPVETCQPEEAVACANRMTQEYEEPFDMIFFDMPGTVNKTSIIVTLSAMDYIFFPISAEVLVLKSTIAFAKVFGECVRAGQTRVRELRMIWNWVDAREKTDLYAEYDKLIRSMGLNILTTTLPDTKKFRKELSERNRMVFRSTLFAADEQLAKSTRLNVLIDELLTVIYPTNE